MDKQPIFFLTSFCFYRSFQTIGIKSLEGAWWHWTLRQWDFAMWTFVSAASSKNYVWTKIRLTPEKLRQCEDVLIEFRSWRNSWTLLLSLWNLVWKPPPCKVCPTSSGRNVFDLLHWAQIINHVTNLYLNTTQMKCYFHAFFWVTFSKSVVCDCVSQPGGGCRQAAEQHHCPWLQHIDRLGTSISSLALSLMIIAWGMCKCVCVCVYTWAGPLIIFMHIMMSG